MYRAFDALANGNDAAINVLEAALLIARLEYPDLDQARCEAQLDELAQRVRAELALPSPIDQAELPAEVEPLAAIQAINKVLFEEEGFHGNREHYYDPDNSYFNKVLEQRCGIPITLSLLYIEVGRRVGLHIEGIALPFQFVTRCVTPDTTLYIDAYEDGLVLSEQECRERIRHMARKRIKIHDHWFEPVNPRFFVARMLNNLKNIYIDREDFERALKICDLLVVLLPRFAGEWRDRGIMHLQLKHYARAKHDLTTYTELAPRASDREEILEHIKSIRQIIATMN
jgi:regulator of sirC expression with transglutaminase-like and TPR domain